MNKPVRFLSQTAVNSFLLAVLVIILAAPIVFSLTFLSGEEASFSAFEITPSADDYNGYLNYGKIAGGQAEEISVNYTAFPDFEAFYDGIFVVENTQKTSQTFIIKEPVKEGVRLFFGKIGADSGPNQIVLEPKEKATINLAAEPVPGNQPATQNLTFTLQSFPER